MERAPRIAVLIDADGREVDTILETDPAWVGKHTTSVFGQGAVEVTGET